MLPMPPALRVKFRYYSGSEGKRVLIVQGNELLASWESSSRFHRFFAGCCGSPIYKRNDAAPEILGLGLGTLDSDPERTGEVHFMYDSKVPWLKVAEGLRRKPGGAPFGRRD